MKRRPCIPDKSRKRVVGCGQACSINELRIVDPETLSECSPGQTGEIWIRGRVLRKILGSERRYRKATFEVFHHDRRGSVLAAGDLGFFSDGELFVTGPLEGPYYH